jgi:hypothetical protein
MESQENYNAEVIKNDDPWEQLDNIVKGWVIKTRWQKDLDYYEELRSQYSYS